jgi:hypothetical protein
MLKTLSPKSNIANKVRNTKLPKTKPLMPLFEVISNSIHAINEAKKNNLLDGPGKIRIKLIRNGNEETLKVLTDIDKYPIHSFEIKDNGIGLNDDNLNFFVESDTDHKIEIGGKGVGRFVCLKAFRKMLVNSCCNIDGKKFVRRFEFQSTKEAFHDYEESDAPASRNIGTTITLSEYKDDFGKHVPFQLTEIAKAIVLHFQLYFIQDNAPEMIVENQNNVQIHLKTLFLTDFKESVQTRDFQLYEFNFKLFLTKLFNGLSHKIHYCAHNRSVKEEGLYNKIIDLGKYPVSDENGTFYYQAYVVGAILDDNVDLERVGFNFPNEEEDEENTEEVTLSKIRHEAINSIEQILFEYLNKIREEKIEKYRPTIHDELPQYRTTLSHKLEEVKKLPPNLSKQKLDIELYKIESNWKIEIKEEGIQLLEEKKDIQNLSDYKERYEKFLTEFNELGKADLARYVVHRKAVIELLENLLAQDDNDKFTNEDIIHSVFFPIRSSSDEVPHDKQNLWLLDERLTYHSFLASDKRFEQIKQLDANSTNRTDLLIFNDALAFTEDKFAPFSSFTIIEFKKPQRDDFQDYDPKKNPLDQTENYIQELLAGNVTNRLGRQIKLDSKTPFYVYIVCDITDTLEAILKKREFNQTPDGQGWYLFKSKYYSAYIEVIPFEKVLSDAKKRNRILFDKLGIGY